MKKRNIGICIITTTHNIKCLTRFYYIITIFFYNTNAYEIY